jgi:hypothetical protein
MEIGAWKENSKSAQESRCQFGLGKRSIYHGLTIE